jgi:glyoxylase-like metal-dependent hydrolase (beta-lactamase superfamily II)
MSLKVESLAVGELEANCFILWLEGATEAVVIDPGGDEEEIEARLKKRGLVPVAFLVTHCHCDHIGALKPLKQEFPDAEIYAPDPEAEWLERPTMNLSYFFGHATSAPNADHTVKDGDTITVAGITLTAVQVPGHSPGSIVYLAQDGTTAHAFCGDVLFAGSIGRTDLPGGEGEDVLVENIKRKVFALPDSTVLHPGHGPNTTVGREREYNPFCGEES